MTEDEYEQLSPRDRWHHGQERHYRSVVPEEFWAAVADNPEVAAWCDAVIAACQEAQGGPPYRAAPDWPQPWSLMLLGPTGVGKALADETLIAGPDGSRPIGALRPGDIVFGGDGRPCTVAAVYPQGIRQLWRVTLRDGRAVTCDADHLWQVRTPWGTRKVLSLAEIQAAGLTRESGLSRWYIPVAGCAEYPSADLPIDPYTLGVLLGDGGFTAHSPAVTTMDQDIIRSLRLPAGVTPRPRPRQRDSQALSWDLVGQRPLPNPLSVNLGVLGLMGHRSTEKFIPLDYLLADRDARIALLAGLVDTDGYVKGASVAVYTSSPQLAEDVRRLVWSLGGQATLRRKETGHAPAWTIHLALPPGCPCPARLARKAARWHSRQDSRGSITAITAIEPAGYGKATCIAVDSSDSTYLTGDYVRTHNTWQAYGAVRRVVFGGEIQLASAGQAGWLAADMAGLLDQLRPRDGVDHVDVFNWWANANLLLVDDLGADKPTEWAMMTLGRLVNHRYARQLPTIWTTNLPVEPKPGQPDPPPTLKSELSGRVFDRLVPSRFVKVEGIDGGRQSWRRPAG